ncbi:glycosyltransferase family 2 protein [Candidatus Roizmanbacteria bacterium]|nr:glycosyltransferase family 2 protein [Candidatus Roizmanbacteria bacterium]
MAFKKLSIIIPVYNEEKLIGQTIEKVMTADSSGLIKEIIVVDDGSTDGTVNNLKFEISNLKSNSNIKLQNPKFIFIEKKKNEGKGAALRDGFMKSIGDIVLVQDADLEYDPSDYPYLLEPFLKNNADVVYGSRFISDRPHRVLYFWHSIINRFLTMLSNIFTNLNLTDMETGFKVFRGDLIRKIAPNLQTKRFGFEPEITARISKIKEVKIYEVGISYAGRTYAEGKKIGLVDGIKALWEIVYFNLFTR